MPQQTEVSLLRANRRRELAPERNAFLTVIEPNARTLALAATLRLQR